MAAKDPDLRRAASQRALAAQWGRLTHEQRKARMRHCVDGLHTYFADLVDPDRALDEVERDRLIDLKRRELAAAAAAKSVATRRANSAKRRRAKLDDDIAELINVVMDLARGADTAAAS